MYLSLWDRLILFSISLYGMEAAAVRTWLQQREGSPPGILSNLWAVQWQGILKSEPDQDPEELLSKFVRTARRRNLVSAS